MTLPSDLSSARVAVIGLGLMGGSLALALRGRCAALLGADIDPQVCRAAVGSGIVDRAATDPAEVLAEADFVILATPVHVILAQLARLPAWIPGEAWVLDLGSTKAAVVRAMRALPPRLAGVGGHPMCGKEVGGLENAAADLFQGATFALTPLAERPGLADSIVEALVRAIGAQPAWLDAETHDRWAAATSHLPYLLSAVLARATPLEAAPLVGTGFRSASRLAATPGNMILPVLGAAPGGMGGNRDHILAALGAFRTELDALQGQLQEQDWGALANSLEEAKQQRARLIDAHRPAVPPSGTAPVPHGPSGPSRRVQHLSGNFFAGLEQTIRELVQAGADVIRLDIGSPDLPPPEAVVARLAQAAARPDEHGYQAHTGLPALRQAWAETYARLYGCDLDPDKQVLPLLGSKEGIFNLSAAWLDPGDVALAPDPGYMTYTRGALYAGAEPTLLHLEAESGFLPDLESVPAGTLRRARLLWLNFPSNPTGATADLAFFERAVAFARKHGLLLAHDAAYSRVYFGSTPPPSVFQIPGALDVAVEFNSLSKSHNMPGWRVGALLGRADVLAAVLRLKTNLDSGHFRPILEAATTALGTPDEWLAARNAVYARRLAATLAALPGSLRAYTPQAAIYLWCRVPDGWSSQRYVEEALQTAQVSLTPGTVFGPSGEGWVRISLTLPEERLVEAMQRLGRL